MKAKALSDKTPSEFCASLTFPIPQRASAQKQLEGMPPDHGFQWKSVSQDYTHYLLLLSMGSTITQMFFLLEPKFKD